MSLLLLTKEMYKVLMEIRDKRLLDANYQMYMMEDEKCEEIQILNGRIRDVLDDAECNFGFGGSDE